ncbi:MAG TPA: hypothetical protein ENK20_12775 [Chromatiales bacterium]|nr:hypothetical protein [Chromatiales bacterium]
MATVNFSVPDEVKRDFDRTFKGENKSAVIARLMRQAVEERRREARRRRLLRRILALRAQAPAASDDEIRKLRHAGRP